MTILYIGKDKYRFCVDLQKWCKTDNFVKANCKKTCCTDLDKNCSSWRRAGYCKGRGFDTWMKTNCPKSCGYC